MASRGLPDSVNAVFPQAIVQACVIHLIRATLRYASRKYWDELAKGPVLHLHRTLGRGGLNGVRGTGEEYGGKPYPTIPTIRTATGEEFIPFLAHDTDIRRVLFSTNTIKSLHTRYQHTITVHEHFPTEQAALKSLYLATRDLDPKSTSQTR